MTFKELNLDPRILKALDEAGYQQPTPIQLQAIPMILSGTDLQASAQTGTGKTAAFTLPCLNRLMTSPGTPGRGPRILVLVPTRELAMQVATEAAKYSRHLPRVKTVCIYGGASYTLQNKELSRPYEILVATPGRLMDHMERGKIQFERLEMFILDEADRMLDMGFIEPVEEIAAALPKNHQTLMFSATLKGNVMKLSKRLLRDPQEVHATPDRVDHENIEQRLYHSDGQEHKYRMLDHLIKGSSINQAIIFTATKRQADQLTDKLFKHGHIVAALHGGMNQRQRTRTLQELRQGKTKILVATDVAARGIDVNTITHVFNFDLPRGTEDYVHRIGRTGRAGAKGVACSFASTADFHLVKQIEKFTGKPMNVDVIAGLEPKFKPRDSAGRNDQPPARRKPFKPRAPIQKKWR
jgi:superfamily II DNA/RNA helicase